MTIRNPSYLRSCSPTPLRTMPVAIVIAFCSSAAYVIDRGFMVSREELYELVVPPSRPPMTTPCGRLEGRTDQITALAAAARQPRRLGLA